MPLVVNFLLEALVIFIERIGRLSETFRARINLKPFRRDGKPQYARALAARLALALDAECAHRKLRLAFGVSLWYQDGMSQARTQAKNGTKLPDRPKVGNGIQVKVRLNDNQIKKLDRICKKYWPSLSPENDRCRPAALRVLLEQA